MRFYEIGEIEKNRYGKPIYFENFVFNRIRRFLDTTQRDAVFAVGYPGEDYTRVHVFIGMLGWWRNDKLKLGGVD
jgi:hypothetical protein